jgi:hypothetical protein
MRAPGHRPGLRHVHDADLTAANLIRGCQMRPRAAESAVSSANWDAWDASGGPLFSRGSHDVAARAPPDGRAECCQRSDGVRYAGEGGCPSICGGGGSVLVSVESRF